MHLLLFALVVILIVCAVWFVSTNVLKLTRNVSLFIVALVVLIALAILLNDGSYY